MAGRGDDGFEEAETTEARADESDSRRDPGSGRFSRLARRLLDRKELAEDTREILSAVLSTSDRAKTEAVRMVAREVRTYLEELRLKEDLRDLLTSHSLEISVHLKPLAAALEEPSAPPAAPDAKRPVEEG
jgi:hypothetical protein